MSSLRDIAELDDGTENVFNVRLITEEGLLFLLDVVRMSSRSDVRDDFQENRFVL